MGRLLNPKQANLKRKCRRIRSHLRNLRREERFWLRHMKRLQTLHRRKEKRERIDLQQKMNSKRKYDRRETAKLNRTLKRRRRR